MAFTRWQLCSDLVIFLYLFPPPSEVIHGAGGPEHVPKMKAGLVGEDRPQDHEVTCVPGGEDGVHIGENTLDNRLGNVNWLQDGEKLKGKEKREL